MAKSDLFIQLATDLAKQVALMGAATPEELLTQPYVDDPTKTVHARVGEVVGLIRENMKPARLARLLACWAATSITTARSACWCRWKATKADTQLLKDVCMHITAKNPLSARLEDVPAGRVRKEKEIVRTQIADEPENKGKPANIIEKMAEGKLGSLFYADEHPDRTAVRQGPLQDRRRTAPRRRAEAGRASSASRSDS